MKEGKNTSNPRSTGGAGVIFETNVQAFFAALLLSEGCAPGLPNWPVTKLRLQGRNAGYETDDCIVFAEEPNGKRTAKQRVSIKLTIAFTSSNENFKEVIAAAWRDFSNSTSFTRNLDSIAIVTNALNQIDGASIPILTDWARSSEAAGNFFALVNSNASSDSKREKLRIIRHELDKSNGSPISDEELWQFLRHFHVLASDLERWSGINRSLIEALLNAHVQNMSQQVWAQIVQFVQWGNHNAGTITRESFPPEILEYFQVQSGKEIPEEFAPSKEEVRAAILMAEYNGEAALAMLMGSWNESDCSDTLAAERLAGEPYPVWIKGLRSLALTAESPLRHKGGRWKVNDRSASWTSLGPSIYDDQLDKFGDLAIAVLREPDPKFDLPKEEHFAARVRGKVAVYSDELKSGAAETLALLGSNPKALTSCTFGKAEGTASMCVRTILENASWRIWATVNDQLPLLAEASPTAFMDAIEHELSANDGQIFRDLFEQEGGAIGGWNYMTGVLWGLETLAWSEEYLGRSSLLLSQIAKLDPGGTWGNRPLTSLANIFVPWLPHTAASVEKRKEAVRAIVRDSEDIGWRLLKSLLPKSNQTVLGSHRPAYRNYIPPDILARVTGKDNRIPVGEYRDQLSDYCGLAVKLAQGNHEVLLELLRDLDDLPAPSFDEMLEFLSSEQTTKRSEEERTEIWEILHGIVINQRKFADAKWARPEEDVNKIERVAKTLQPLSPHLLHKRLFGSHEAELYEIKGAYEAQRKEVEVKRSKAVDDIFASAGIEGVLKFAQNVHLPVEVGLALGKNGHTAVDEYLLPAKLISADKKVEQFVYGYLWTRLQAGGWKWFDALSKIGWTREKVAALFRNLPFEEETWKRVDDLLAQETDLYWKKVEVRPFRVKQGLELATRRLLAVQRPNAAIACLSWMLIEKIPAPRELVYSSLQLASPAADDPTPFDAHEVTEFIKLLQDDSDADKQQLKSIEWRFLELLEHDQGNGPITLETALGHEAEFFCEVIQTVFRSELSAAEPEKEKDESQQAFISRVFKLIWNWSTPPGLQQNGTFDAVQLRDWLTKVKTKCKETGHLGSALSQIGKALAHAPADPDGLWIHSGAAEVLDETDASRMRSGFTTELLNMRGVYWDTKGEAERSLAIEFRKKAGEVEQRGYLRLGAEIRRLAAGYDRQADREAQRNEPEG